MQLILQPSTERTMREEIKASDNRREIAIIATVPWIINYTDCLLKFYIAYSAISLQLLFQRIKNINRQFASAYQLGLNGIDKYIINILDLSK